MSIFHNLRSNVFWLLDSIEGGFVAKHYKEIESVLENFNSEQSYNIRKKRLQEVIDHAIGSTDYYRAFKSGTKLTQLPVVDKNIIRDNFQSFKSSTIVPKRKVKTSGSTGTPFAVFQDFNKRKRNIADTLYFANKAGFKLGSKLVFIRVWSGQNKSKITAWLQNIEKQDVTCISKNPKKLLDYLRNNNSDKGIVAHASSLENISKYIENNSIKHDFKHLNSVIATSESLNMFTRDKLSKQLNTPVVSRYSNIENGIIAQQNTNGDWQFEINWASYYVEILKLDEDEPVRFGELGRVVITDLFNFSVPMLRYNTGDIASMELSNQGVPMFKTVEGRKLDLVYDTNANVLPSLLLGTLMEKYDGIRQFQFIQEDKKRYILKLNVTDTYKDEVNLIKEFTQILGPGSRINIVYTNEIPLLSSGKRRYVVNNYHNKEQKYSNINIAINGI